MGEVAGVSLVVPVKDESSSIDALLDSIQRQVRQPDEIVLVDGGSTDDTCARIRRLTAGDARYRLVEAGDATPGRGRNVGIEAAAHPWIALTDAGIVLDPHWLERLLRPVEHDPGIDMVYGSFATARASFFERGADLAYVTPLAASPVGPVRSRFIASCLLHREAWRRAGGFPDLRAAEDLIFLRRLDDLGARSAIAAEARVIWHLQPTVRSTFSRFRRYSMHNVLAGQQRQWHHGVARQYVAVFGLVALARAVRRSPVPVVACAAGARSVRTLWRRREGRGVLWAVRPDRVVAVAGILAVVDAATFAGWADAITLRRRRSA